VLKLVDQRFVVECVLWWILRRECRRYSFCCCFYCCDFLAVSLQGGLQKLSAECCGDIEVDDGGLVDRFSGG
jgi:hypothetical protein